MVDIRRAYERYLTVTEVEESSSKRCQILSDVTIQKTSEGQTVEINVELDGEEYIMNLSKAQSISLARLFGYETKAWADKTFMVDVENDSDTDEQVIVIKKKVK